ncbi:MAG: hypothetical protein MI976_00610 [Pseudomonadales bacterium]|nr:hypothetical protein [Pseudomonadales bacterium]
MAEFYIENAAQSNGDHLVHFSHCDSLPSMDEMRYLGSIASYDSAKTEGKKIFMKVNACTSCASKHATTE